eukprot:6947531-Pyramimonas_sp.AAC.3
MDAARHPLGAPPPGLSPPGGLRIQIVQELSLLGGYPCVAARPALLVIHDRGQRALQLVDGAKALTETLAALQLPTQFFHPPLRCRGALFALEFMP